MAKGTRTTIAAQTVASLDRDAAKDRSYNGLLSVSARACNSKNAAFLLCPKHKQASCAAPEGLSHLGEHLFQAILSRSSVDRRLSHTSPDPGACSVLQAQSR
jgi:hypothetical protein